MTNVSISELKAKPAQFIKQSLDYPVAVENRNEITAYLIGKDLFERIVTYLEDYLDKKVIDKTNFSKWKDFSKVASELGL